MAQNDPTNVSVAFEMLLETIEDEIDFQSQLGTQAFQKHDYDAAHKAADYAAQIGVFRDKVATFRKEWETLVLSHQDIAEDVPPGTQRHDLGRLPKGIATPQSAYRQPILQVLIEMGGSARMSEVLMRVEQLMRGSLKQVDYEPLPSDETQRWSKSAQWARNRLAREGLLKSDSPRGIWEISDKGRKALKL
jgi:restriction system protein